MLYGETPRAFVGFVSFLSSRLVYYMQKPTGVLFSRCRLRSMIYRWPVVCTSYVDKINFSRLTEVIRILYILDIIQSQPPLSLTSYTNGAYTNITHTYIYIYIYINIYERPGSNG